MTANEKLMQLYGNGFLHRLKDEEHKHRNTTNATVYIRVADSRSPMDSAVQQREVLLYLIPLENIKTVAASLRIAVDPFIDPALLDVAYDFKMLDPINHYVVINQVGAQVELYRGIYPS
jgi:hypothetical protein